MKQKEFEEMKQKLVFAHLRQYVEKENMDGKKLEIWPRGGITIAIDKDNKKYQFSICSKQDSYWKKRGVNIATGRLLARGIDFDSPDEIADMIKRLMDKYKLNIRVNPTDYMNTLYDKVTK